MPRTLRHIPLLCLLIFGGLFAVAIEGIFGVTLPVAHGTTLYLTPHTDDDCLEFDQWSDGNTDNPREFVYEGVAPTFVAQFKTKVYTITVNTDDDTQGSVSVTLLP